MGGRTLGDASCVCTVHGLGQNPPWQLLEAAWRFMPSLPSFSTRSSSPRSKPRPRPPMSPRRGVPTVGHSVCRSLGAGSACDHKTTHVTYDYDDARGTGDDGERSLASVAGEPLL